MDARSRRGGRVPTHRERNAAGQVRLDIYIPHDVAEALARLCEREAEERGLPPERCRTAAVIRAILAADAKKPASREG